MKKIGALLLGAALSVCLFAVPAAAFSEDQVDYVLDNSGEKIPIPLSYTCIDVIDWFGEEYGSLKEPEDLFYDGNGGLYIADTGNNRILKCSLNGEVIQVYSGEGQTAFNSPKGLFVDKADGSLYVADTGNKRVLQLNKDGGFIKEYIRPDSELLSDSLTFDPNKVAVSQTGFIYVLKGKQFISIDKENAFKGFVGMNEVPFSLKNLLISIFATDEQRRQIKKVEPDPYSNFVMDNEGMLYAVALSDKNQIRKINSVGRNVYPPGIYCEYIVDETGKVLSPSIRDLTVSQNGIITVVEENTSQLYQYDQDGNLLTVFGGKGNKKGYFDIPCSVVEDENGRLYVLDQAANNIQILEPTRFIQSVHTALGYYYDGDYDQARIYWEQALESDGNYPFAGSGLGKSLYKDKNFSAAMSEYRKAGDKEGYSKAFSEYRHDIFRQYFGMIILAATIFAVGIVVLIIFLKKKADKIQKTYGLR